MPLRIVLSDAETFVKQKTKTGLCWGIAVLGEWIPVAERGDVVAAVIRRQARSKIAGSRRLTGRQQQDDKARKTAQRRGKHKTKPSTDVLIAATPRASRARPIRPHGAERPLFDSLIGRAKWLGLGLRRRLAGPVK